MAAETFLYFVIGILLLVGGRKFFWFFVGAIGFITGFTLAENFLGVDSFLISMSIGVILGVIGMVVALFLQGFAIVAGGFLAGVNIAYIILKSLGPVSPEILWISCIGGGILGAILLFLLFDWALILLSSMAGGAVITDPLTLDPKLETAIAIVLTLLGIFFQTKIFLREKKS